MTVKKASPPLLGRREAWLAPLLIFVLAFAVRLIYLNQVSDSPLFQHPIMDEKYHVELAHQINSTSGLPDEPFYRAPLYPYVLAFLFRVTSNSFYATRLIQCVAGSFVPVLILVFGLLLFSKRVAYGAAITGAVYPTLVYYDATLLITSLMVLLTALLVWQLYRCQRRFSLLNFAVAGVLLGLAGLARPNILLLGPALFIWIWLVVKDQLGWRRAVIRYAIVAIGAFVVVLPVTIRNYRVSGDFVPIAWQGGFNFYLGNNRDATGWSATAPGIEQTWEGGYRDAIAIADQMSDRQLTKSEISDFWYDRAWSEILSDPGRFLGLQIKKIRLFLNGYEIPNNQNIYFAREESWLMKPLMFTGLIYFPYGILAPLMLIGIGLSLKEWRKYLLLYLTIGSYVISLLLFFVCARYRQPLIPFLLLFAWLAVVKIFDLIRSRSYRSVAAIGALFILLALESNHDMLGLKPATLAAQDYLNIGNVYLGENRVSRAQQEFKAAVRADSTYAQGHHNLGITYARQGKLAQAQNEFLLAIKYEPFVVGPYLSLATAYLDSDRPKEAAMILERAVGVQPLNYLAHFKLGMTYYELGEYQKALEACERALKLNPDDTTVQNVYRQIQEAAKGVKSP